MAAAHTFDSPCRMPWCFLRTDGLICPLNTLWLMLPSRITMERPAKMLETKNRMGMNSLYHRGWILSFAIRYMAPSPDWCRVDRVMPKITAARVMPPRILRARRAPSHSATAGENSMSSASMYSRKCQATRNSTELVPKLLPMMGLTTFHGRPRSRSRAPA